MWPHKTQLASSFCLLSVWRDSAGVHLEFETLNFKSSVVLKIGKKSQK